MPVNRYTETAKRYTTHLYSCDWVVLIIASHRDRWLMMWSCMWRKKNWNQRAAPAVVGQGCFADEPNWFRINWTGMSIAAFIRLFNNFKINSRAMTNGHGSSISSSCQVAKMTSHNCQLDILSNGRRSLHCVEPNGIGILDGSWGMSAQVQLTAPIVSWSFIAAASTPAVAV